VQSQRGQVLLPLADGEALAAAVGGDGADGEQELPGADVEHAVASGIDEGQDGRGHRHADAAQPGQQLHPAALAARGQHRAGHGTDARRRIGPPQAHRARTLPPAHPNELGTRERTTRAHAGQLADERRGGGMLVANQLATQQDRERGVARRAQRHRDSFT